MSAKKMQKSGKTEVGSSGSVAPRTTCVFVFLKSVRRPN